ISYRKYGLTCVFD
ncbi:hypothetical protein CP061683_0047B, partial [Chlamydia psittaci 06-1683]